ncbi:GGDEF domain-containing protein [Pusillimonas sp. CC-YST705]|uniref:diguanylate cyclase n=1 Tax=Mesopusillimonas faecipullorum TaxID=2755040 RepID=A0ABS8CCF6_9BURK|nr:GGDEF domain-containing protein [Mesopusillimonas faecipullorum]MCB5363715.1 GGDEF domain-containing protein [Mesopusillimonas faecipullorum]
MIGLFTLKNKFLELLRDALAHRSYSRDFAYVRNEYLRTRITLICTIFLVLLPFWSLLDWIMLPSDILPYLWPARIAMAVLLGVVLLLARYARHHLPRVLLACGLLLATPAAFYALLLAVIPQGTPPLIGYSFIPYMLVVMLAIFPFTLLESSVLGLSLLVLQAFALYRSEILFTSAGIQDLWLLVALLSIAVTANYFQLALMLRLHREATHDPLTGLLNRGALMRSMTQLSTRGDTSQTALLMMDLDHFKRINDQYGHMSGDDVLRHFTRQLSQTLRPTDIASRYGGEEFMAVLVDTDLPTALELAERIRHRTETSSLQDHEGNTIRYTVSIGIAMLKPGKNFETAIREADNRLYEAKRQARNRVVAVDTP